MDDELTKARDIFLGGVNQVCSKLGLNNIMAQLYALLYLSDAPLSLNDMLERLKISKGSTSVNIRALEQYGAVKRVWMKGSRRDYYEAETDIAKVILERIKSIIQKRLSEIDNMITDSHQALNSVNSVNGNVEKNAIKVFEQRLEALKNLYDNAQQLFNLFNTTFLPNMLNNVTKKENVKTQQEHV